MMRSNSCASSSKCFLIVSMAAVNEPRDGRRPSVVGLGTSVLDGIDPHLSALSCTSWNRQEKAVHALSLPAKISGGTSAQRGGNLGEELIVVRIFHLKNIDRAFPSGHVNTL